MIEPICLARMIALWKRPSPPIPSPLLDLVALDTGVLDLRAIASFLGFCQDLKLEGKGPNRWSSMRFCPMAPVRIPQPPLMISGSIFSMTCPKDLSASCVPA